MFPNRLLVTQTILFTGAVTTQEMNARKPDSLRWTWWSVAISRDKYLVDYSKARAEVSSGRKIGNAVVGLPGAKTGEKWVRRKDNRRQRVGHWWLLVSSRDVCSREPWEGDKVQSP